jgi:ketosteroid isomerase-like protein
MSSSSQTAANYLNAFWSGDMEAARGLVADDFSFRGPFVQVEGKDAFFASAAGLIPIIRGYRMLRQWGDGEDVCSYYEFDVEAPGGKGSVQAAEWSRVRDGRLASSRLVFDTAAFRKLVPAARGA